MATVKATDINSYYTKINSIRTRFGLATKTFPSASAGGKILATEMNSVDTELTQTVTDVNTTIYRGNISKSGSYSVTAGTLILETLNSNINSLLSTWSTACVNCSSYCGSDWGDCSYNSSNNAVVCSVCTTYEPSYTTDGCPDYDYGTASLA